MTIPKRPWRSMVPRIPLLLLSMFAVVVLLLLGPYLLRWLQRPLSSVGVWTTSQWRQRVPGFGFVLAEDRGLLEERLTQCLLQTVSLEPLRQENQNLKDQIAFFERQSFRHVTARVLSRSADPLQSTFLVDRGSDDGIRLGAPVVVGKGMIVGKVTEVFSHAALVRSLGDRRSKLSVSLLADTRPIGILEGTSGFLLMLRFVPNDQLLAVDDLVITSGQEEGIPSGLLVGIVNGVSRDPEAPFQQAFVEPIVDSSQYSLVSVILPDISP
ncbi:rod shape-determining protein MreC [Candidatus Uhrbacteria bacterium]|nr:rod shape-determining protein MreC [Candidatus Uhrbacteria bacterium]